MPNRESYKVPKNVTSLADFNENDEKYDKKYEEAVLKPRDCKQAVQQLK